MAPDVRREGWANRVEGRQGGRENVKRSSLSTRRGVAMLQWLPLRTWIDFGLNPNGKHRIIEQPGVASRSTATARTWPVLTAVITKGPAMNADRFAIVVLGVMSRLVGNRSGRNRPGHDGCPCVRIRRGAGGPLRLDHRNARRGAILASTAGACLLSAFVVLPVRKLPRAGFPFEAV